MSKVNETRACYCRNCDIAFESEGTMVRQETNTSGLSYMDIHHFCPECYSSLQVDAYAHKSLQQLRKQYQGRK